MKQLSDFEIGVLTGLFSAEGSFGGDGRQPQLTLKLHPRRQPLADWLLETVEGSRLHGPYESGGRGWLQWSTRGKALVMLLEQIEEPICRLDAHAASRIEAMRSRYRL